MKNRFIRYTIFFILLVIADRFTGWAISHYSKLQIRDNRIGQLIDGKINADILIIGSSRALNNYNPAIISERLGKTCYNIGISGSDIHYHEAVLDIAINAPHKPSAIIYSVDDQATFFKMMNVIFRKDVLYPFIDNDLVNKIINSHLGRTQIATDVSSSYRQNVNFINAIKYLNYGREEVDYKTNNFDSLGANILLQRKEDPFPSFRLRTFNLAKWEIDSTNWAAFQRIQEKCKNANIKIVFVLPPVLTTNFPGFKSITQSAIREPFRLIDQANSFTDSTLFFNVDHLNNKGANLFTNNLCDELKKINF